MPEEMLGHSQVAEGFGCLLPPPKIIQGTQKSEVKIKSVNQQD